MKKICYVCTSLNQLGGKTAHFPKLFKNLTRRGFQIDFVLCSSIEDALKKRLISAGIPEEHLIFIKRFKKWLLFPFLWNLMRIFKSRQYDIVHTFQVQSDVFGGLAAKWAGIQKIFSYYESKIIPENISYFKITLYKAVNLCIKDIFHKTVVVSNGLKQEFIEKQFRKADTLTVIPLGIDVPAAVKDQRMAFSQTDKGLLLVGTLSRLSHEKALHRLVDAAALVVPKVADIRFVIYGDGPERSRLEGQIQQLGLAPYFEFVEWTDKVFDALSALDIFVIPSIREGCPIALMEAMGCARPVIASDIEGIRDLIRDKKEGRLVDTSDKQKFAACIIEMLENPDLAVRMGKAAKERLVSSFSEKDETEKLCVLYKSS